MLKCACLCKRGVCMHSSICAWVFLYLGHYYSFVRFPEFPAQFPYKAKAIFLFQECDGTDISIFGMHVQEYGSECPYPNSRYILMFFHALIINYIHESFQTCVHILSGQCSLLSAQKLLDTSMP